MTNYLVTDTELTDVADAIRTKGETSSELEWPDGYIDAIDAIETGGGGATLIMESGQITQDTAAANLVISFSGVHTDPPVIWCIARVDDNDTFSSYPTGAHVYCGELFTEMLGVGTILTNSSSPYHCDGMVCRYNKNTSSMAVTGLYTTTDAATKWSTYASNTGLIIPSTTPAAKGTFKWIAIWKSW